ncbi:hypothetical protein FD755_007801 [Muntiacus reevesi]|uniref:60S ribosomal protein L37a n=1 Tax=Muntiacus reevesi TaxID=9886 RepID=A0A5J5MK61_MUNRE|nr:hypothetical protein FD755_007801 [Muntiacus reevesi]
MTNGTKVRTVGKYKTHYSTNNFIRKAVKKVEISQHTKYTCSFCGKTKTERRLVAGSCGGWTYNTISVVTVKSAIRRLKRLKDQ